MPAKGDPPVWHHFVRGGLGDMGATLVSHPMDVLKVRMQLLGERDAKRPSIGLKDYRQALRQLAAAEAAPGPLGRPRGCLRGLYAGLSAAMLRHSVFSTLRHGLNKVFEDRWSQSIGGVNFLARICCASSAGAIAGFVANPADVVLIRMQADGAAPPAAQRGYAHALDGVARVAREEGPGALYRGVGATVLRASLVTTSQIASFGTAKAALEEHTSIRGVGLQLASAAASGTVACLVTSPVDVVKTRVMNSAGTSTYAGPMDCVLQTLRTEGPFAFYKGLTATFLRLFPHTVALWMLQDRITVLLQRLNEGSRQ